MWNTLTDDTSILKTATASNYHIIVWTTKQHGFIPPTAQTINMDWQAAFSKWRVVQGNSSCGMQVTTAWNDASTIQMFTMKINTLLQRFNILTIASQLRVLKIIHTMWGESKLSANNRGILMSPEVVTHSPISPSYTHLNSTNTEFIVDQIDGHGRDCAVIVYAQPHISLGADS